uniref:UVR domain-containing protein n=1 Tax=Oryza punctata TaxID=4537 RepID=A0A0E0K637_ORYPU
MAAPNPSGTMAAAATPARAWWRSAAPASASTAAVSFFRVGAKSLTGLQMTSTCTNKVRTVHVKSGEAEGSPSTESITRDEETLQRDLQTAIQEEDYAQAAKLRDELRVLQEDSRSAVLAANARFYNAFKNGDLVAMHSAWAKGDHVYVVHPSAGRISGYDMVMQSWEMVCDADYEFPIQIDLQDVEVHVRGDLGYVTCLELVKTKGSSSWGRQVATNVFEKVDGKWFMCIHHASHFDE